MRAWIEYNENSLDSEDHDFPGYATICEYIDGKHSETNLNELKMPAKPYYIEYEVDEWEALFGDQDNPEEMITWERNMTVDGNTEKDERVALAPVKVKVDIEGLSNSEIIDLLEALNAAGFEAVITRAAVGAQVLENDKWYPTSPPYTTPAPYTWPPTIISNTEKPVYGERRITDL